MTNQKWFIPTPLHSVKDDRGAYGYNPEVVSRSQYYNERAEYEYVGFMIFRSEPDSKGRKQIFIPSEPKNDYGYIDRVYVITKAGYVTKCSYPSNEYIKVDEGTIFVGAECNRYSYGIAMANEKAKPWIDKNNKGGLNKMTIQDFVKKGVRVINDMGELRVPRASSIPFSNGWVASIVKVEDRFSVAVCDYNGYFNWSILNDFGANDKGKFSCENEDEVCKALSVIESL